MKHFNLLVFFIAALAIRNSSSYCPVCSLKLREIQEARLKVIQKEILDKLGLIHAPNITRRGIPKIPPVLKLMESERNQLNAIPDNFEEDNYHAKTQRIILFPEKAPQLIADQVKNCCYFTFTGKANEQGLRVHKATLQVYVKREPNTGKTNAKRDLQPSIKMYQRGFPISKGTPQKILIESKALKKGKKESWYVFNIRSLVKRWRRHPHMNLGIDLEIDGDDSYVLVEDSNTAFQPFLEVHTKNKKKRRHKRQGESECGFGAMERSCCRVPLVVDFQKLGWNWVIAPQRFNANYCTGECEAVLPRFPHTHLVTKVKENASVICCTPSQMTSISMLYFDMNNKIMFEKVPAMVAETCGCS